MADPVLLTSIMGGFALGAAKKAGELSFSGLMSALNSLPSTPPPVSRPKEFDSALVRYERQTFDRCIQVKTLINRDAPVDILSIYVPVRFRYNNEVLDQFDLIEKIPSLRMLTITGTGGSGKSMFMRYLWLSFFESPHGRIPIFLELRNYNDITFDDFVVFIFNSIFSGVENSDGVPYFIHMLSEGKFTFILDGFDEVSEERKKTLLKQLLTLSNKFPNNIFVISTRPLDSINSMPSFHNYNVCPMTKDDVLLLINKIEFPSKVKSKFSKAIRSNLFKTHKTFLEIPLLATIMLFLFNDIADIPNEMHVFYEQAFWTLFRRHDASKDAFDRKLNCGLPMDTFRNAVAAFCFFSYIGGKPNLSEIEIMNYISKASQFLSVSFDSDAFRKDLVNNICFLQLDGIDYVFIHRTFQEYFSAMFIANRPEDEWLEAALVLPCSSSENAIRMLYSMNKEKFNNSVIYKLSDSLQIEGYSIDKFLNRLISLEGSGPRVSILFHRRARTSNVIAHFMYVSMYQSRVYRFLLYYKDECLGLNGDRIFPHVQINQDRIPKSLLTIIRSHLKAKSQNGLGNAFYPDDELYLGFFSSHEDFIIGDTLNDFGEPEKNEISLFVKQNEAIHNFMRIVQELCKVMNDAVETRTTRKSFSALIGRKPLFV